MRTITGWEILILITALSLAWMATYEYFHTSQIPTPQPDLLDDLEIVEDTED